MRRIYWIGLVMVVLAGCGGGDGHSDERASGANGHHDEAGATLTLNDGERWLMDEHTRQMIAQIHATVEDEDVAGADDARALGDTLQVQLNLLIQGCTMEGAAHDQLHVFLGEFIPAVGDMKATASADEGRKNLEHIKALLAEYDRTFR